VWHQHFTLYVNPHFIHTNKCAVSTLYLLCLILLLLFRSTYARKYTHFEPGYTNDITKNFMGSCREWTTGLLWCHDLPQGSPDTFTSVSVWLFKQIFHEGSGKGYFLLTPIITKILHISRKFNVFPHHQNLVISDAFFASKNLEHNGYI
jgi:hypothetical protein